MTSTTAVLVMLNNYLHDVATALLLLAALWLGWSARDLGEAPSPEVLAVFRRSYRRCLRFAVASLLAIVATGAIRTRYFMELEWLPALGRGLTPVLLLKHALIFVMLGVGVWAWVGLRRRLRAIPGWRSR